MERSQLLLILCLLLSFLTFSQGRAPAVEPVYSLEAEIQPEQPLTEASMMRVNFFNPPTESIVHVSSETNSNAVTFTVLTAFMFLPLLLMIMLGNSQPKKVLVNTTSQRSQEVADPILPKNVTSLEKFRDQKSTTEEAADDDQDKSDKVA